jgi:hypothetical protein
MERGVTRLFLGGLLTLGVVAAVPFTIVIGVLAVYFLAGGTNAFVLGVLAVAGIQQPSDPPVRLLLVGPAMAALGAAGLAILAGYFWLIAIMFRTWRVDRRRAR